MAAEFLTEGRSPLSFPGCVVVIEMRFDDREIIVELRRTVEVPNVGEERIQDVVARGGRWRGG